MIWKYVAILALIASVMSGAYYRGAADKEAELQAQFQEARLKQLEESQDKQARLEKDKAELDKYYTERLLDAEEVIDDVLSGIESGERRLYVNTPKTTCRVPKDASIASVDRSESRAELDKNSAREILRLTERGDRYAIQLNACVDAYNRVKKEINNE